MKVEQISALVAVEVVRGIAADRWCRGVAHHVIEEGRTLFISHSEHKEVLREAFAVFEEAALNYRPDGSRTLMEEIETLFLSKLDSDLHVAAIPRLLGKMSSEATSQVIEIGDRVR